MRESINKRIILKINRIKKHYKSKKIESKIYQSILNE